MRVEGQSRSARFTPVKTRYPSYRRLGGPQGRYGLVRAIFLNAIQLQLQGVWCVPSASAMTCTQRNNQDKVLSF
jgi:hypothetical protein